MQMHGLVCVPTGRQNEYKFTALESHKSSFLRKLQMGWLLPSHDSTRLNAIKLKYVSALRIVPSVVTLLCKLKCNKELGLRNAHVLNSCLIVLHTCVIVMIVLYSVLHNIDFRSGAV